jgi:predicted dehydrogenase
MKFLIAGFGSIGRRHFRNLKALGQRDILFYRSGRSQLDDAELAGHTVEHDLAAALAHKPDAVIVANPTALHLDVALPAAQAGCHILLEKPISHSLAGVDELAAVAQASGSRILVGFQFRFHPGLQQAAQLIASGELGQVLSARAHWGEYLPNWHPYEDFRGSYAARADLGGGVVLTLCHPFDYLRWLLGEVNAVWGSLGRSAELAIDVESQAEVGLEFSNAALASVHLDYLQRPGAHWLQLTCANATLHWDAASGALVQRNADGSQREFPPPSGFEGNDLFLEQTRHFVDVVAGAAQPACTLQDGRRALQIALAVHESAATGKRVQLQ